MKRFIALSLGFFMLIAPASSDDRSTFIDFVLVMDTSLSMAGPIEAAKRYAAAEIIGRLAMPGDWATVISFYGKSEIVWSGDIKDESDKASLVRSLNTLQATGRFTDIGSALDFTDRAVLARGMPERPKYILLITDERQEAPAGSPYYADDYQVHHPLLEYVRRQDMGTFRVLTIGFGLAGRIEGEARTLMTTLSEPPKRPTEPLPGSPAAGSAGDGSAGAASSGASGSSVPGSSNGTPNAASNGVLNAARSAWPFVAGTLALAIAVFVLLAAKRQKKAETTKREGKPREP